ncbi:MAG: hypothetical protein H0X47_00985 [Nitrospirales bacterium]|nr:hypothetical protein [Nitrospirales bacterium]
MSDSGVAKQSLLSVSPERDNDSLAMLRQGIHSAPIPRGHYIRTPIILVGNSRGAKGDPEEDKIVLIILVYLDSQ